MASQPQWVASKAEWKACVVLPSKLTILSNRRRCRRRRLPTQVYENTTSLRYGHLMIMTDQDHDGSHIKGLIMNFLHSFFPSLLRIPGFLLEFITPIVKVRRGPRWREAVCSIPMATSKQKQFER